MAIKLSPALAQPYLKETYYIKLSLFKSKVFFVQKQSFLCSKVKSSLFKSNVFFVQKQKLKLLNKENFGLLKFVKK